MSVRSEQHLEDSHDYSTVLSLLFPVVLIHVDFVVVLVLVNVAVVLVVDVDVVVVVFDNVVDDVFVAVVAVVDPDDLVEDDDDYGDDDVVDDYDDDDDDDDHNVELHSNHSVDESIFLEYQQHHSKTCLHPLIHPQYFHSYPLHQREYTKIDV